MSETEYVLDVYMYAPPPGRFKTGTFRPATVADLRAAGWVPADEVALVHCPMCDGVGGKDGLCCDNCEGAGRIPLADADHQRADILAARAPQAGQGEANDAR